MKMSTNYDGELQQYVRGLVLEHLGYRSHRDRGVEDNIYRRPDAENENPMLGGRKRTGALEAQRDE